MNQSLHLLVVFGFALCGAASLSAQPDIGSAMGIVSDNQVITITGTGFGTKSPAAPILCEAAPN